MMKQIDKSIHIVGMSTVTCNEAAQTQNTIGKLWNEFLTTSIKNQLTNISSASIFAVYSDYESDYDGKYKITIGYAVDDFNNVPSGLTTATIPTGKYKIFKSQSSEPKDILDTWKMIWQMDSNVLQPNFITTFEEYKDNEVIIHIGYD